MEYIVAYYRVSTRKQGKSGLGLEAQKSAVHTYVKNHEMEILKEFIEVDKRSKNNRPVLSKALEFCRENNATLVVKNLDRLTNKMSFISNLMDQGQKFIAVDTPFATKFMIYILTAVAEMETELLSKRTKDALNMAKARGVKLGSYAKVLSEKNRVESQKFAASLAPIIQKLNEKGITACRKVAIELNKRKVRTLRKGKRWHTATVYNMLKKMRENNLK